MQQVAQSFTFIEPDEPKIITVETNLYELIEAIIMGYPGVGSPTSGFGRVSSETCRYW